MNRLLLILLAIDSVLLVTAILLQAGKGGGLASTFGGASSSADSIMGTRQAGNLLTKASWWCGGIFIGLAFLLSLTSNRRVAPSSVLDRTFPVPGATAPSATTQPAASVLPVQVDPAPDAKAKAKAPAGDAKAKAPTPPPTKSP